MKKFLIILTSFIMVISFTGCTKKSDKTQSDKAVSTATNVTVEVAAEDSISDVASYTGEIKASESAAISAKVSGNAKAVYVEVGDYVNAGDILVKIDDTDYRIQYNQAQAMYNQALAQYNSVSNGTAQQTELQLEASLNAAKIEYNNALTNYNNQKVLYEAGAISKVAFDQAVTRLENAELNLKTAQSNYDLTVNVVLDESKATAKAALDSAAVQLEAAQNAINNTTVRAPISGYIATRYANAGQMIAPGVEIFSIKSTSSVDVHLNVTESDIPYIKVGAKASVRVNAVSEEIIEGSVKNASAVKNAQTGMYAVTVQIEDSQDSLNDGMFADVEISLNESENAIIIPAQALLENEDGTKYVYVADGDTAKRVDVVTGIVTDEKAEIISGINAGDKVVVEGKEYLSETNNTIKIVE